MAWYSRWIPRRPWINPKYMNMSYMNAGYNRLMKGTPSSKRKRGYKFGTRRRGYSYKTIQKFGPIRPEHKVMTMSAVATQFPANAGGATYSWSTGNWVHVTNGSTLINQGSGVSERIGNRIQIDKIFIRMMCAQDIAWIGDTPSRTKMCPGYVHCLLILDTQPTGSAPTDLSLYPVDSITSIGDMGLQLPDPSKTRLRVLKHRKVSLDAISGEVEHIDINYTPRKPITVVWKDTDAVPQKNSIYVLFYFSGMGLSTVDTSFLFPKYSYKVRIRFYDA